MKESSASTLPSPVLCILFSSGGTADVGRHAVQAAIETYDGPIRVLTRDTQVLQEANWNCACPEPHQLELQRLDVRAVDVNKDDLKEHLKDVGIVISALGNRQPFHGDCVAQAGTRNLVNAMLHHNISRLVIITSAGCNEDFPPMEYHWTGTILRCLFRSVSRREYRDLCLAEDVLRNHEQSDQLDYLIVRPVGLSEERPPVHAWVIQKQKYEDKLGPDMSKMDCARFCLQEALQPTYHRQAVVIGSDPETFVFNPNKSLKSNRD
ncbi:hypothetical protein FisN_4Hh217 [Fistulifera solaris]|uniref:NAD(P)-binding domain-containing protein n=1 Tax=Fistulifera solaris TaxID=1519565 RepID=A0A1Z5KEH1_FISSO|nr:hypothetical protein FisN_4Hh217 [Fistulifera solaris]|eukprot:GAX24659.1 hypothetical protein FisN_4Hh217 [Fistulifera solaris]